MTEGLAWLAALGVLLIAGYLLIYDYQRKQQRSEADYKRDLQDQGVTGHAFAKAGLLDLEKKLKPNLESAISFLADEQKGQTKTKKQGDDKDRTNTKHQHKKRS